MSDFLRGIEERFVDNEGDAEKNYDRKMLDRLLTKLASATVAKKMGYEAGDEYGFAWFNDNYDCPLKLHASRVKGADLVRLVIPAQMPKTAVWARYFEVKAEHDKAAAVGLIFRVPNCSNWIMHNSTRIPPQRGQNMIVRPAVDIEKQLVVCRYDAFLAGLSEIWGVDNA